MSHQVRVLVLGCTLSSSPSASSSELLGRQILAAFQGHGAVGEAVRVVDHQVSFGVAVDQGEGDGWPSIREKLLTSDVLVISTPIWMGQPSSVCKMVLERLDAEISGVGDDGLPLVYGKVAMVGVVGNEDGAHHVIAECLQGLNDVGFTSAANASTYWVGQAMQTTDYQDLEETPAGTASSTATAVANTLHLARLLGARPYPAA